MRPERMNGGRRAAGPSLIAAGFSLVEVLLAVLVLGLGLLGLAAVFPVVISQQRQAGETIAATGVAANVEALLLDGSGAPGLRSILRDPQFGRFRNQLPTTDTDAAWGELATGLWVPVFTWGGHDQVDGRLFGGGAISDVYREQGAYVFGVGLYQPRPTQRGANGTPVWPPLVPATDPAHPGVTNLPMDARLYPTPFTGSEPLFVWDVVPRRTTRNTLELAVFVRRIETGIRVPDGATLSEIVTTRRNSPQFGTERRLAVGVNRATLTPTGRGADLGAAGDDDYATPLVAAAELRVPTNAAERNRFAYDMVVLSSPFDDAGMQGPDGVDSAAYSNRAGRRRPAWLDAASRPGQTLIDNLGVVRTVLGEVTEPPSSLTVAAQREVLVRVEPAYSQSAERPAGSLEDQEPGDRERTLWQVVFTPQAPVRAFVRELRVPQ